MQTGTREKISLVVFICLILIASGGLIGYLAIGHQWNVAATNIDDATGSMDGYTAILFEGTQPLIESKKSEVPDIEGNTGSKADGKNTINEEDSSGESSDFFGISSLLTPDDEQEQSVNNDSQERGTNQSESSVSDSSEGSAEGNNEPVENSNTSGEETESDSSTKSSSGSDIDTQEDSLKKLDDSSVSDSSLESNIGSTSESTTSKKNKELSLTDAEESYLDKNAAVLCLDTKNLPYYYDGIIIKKGTYRFGVFGLQMSDTPFKIERQITYFQKHEVDFILAITPDSRLVEKVRGIDIVISTKDEGLFVLGETINDSFYVSTPTIGSVGAIIISPSNVVSAKVLSEE